MVERLVLPEGCPGAAENLVGHAAGSPFEPSHDGGHRGTRFEDCMDVIWHDHPRVEFVEPADCLTVEESVHNYAGDSRILQPGGTGSYAVESLVLPRSEEHTSELQSLRHLVCRLLLEKKKSENLCRAGIDRFLFVYYALIAWLAM